MRSAYYGDYSYMTRVEEQRMRRLARSRQVKRQKLLLIIGVLVTMAFISFFSVKAFANTEGSADCFGTKQYKSIMIYCGDTVESIAEENYSFIYTSPEKMADEIRSINHLGKDDSLVPGNYIVIPYLATASGY
jgi:hypothetical protein